MLTGAGWFYELKFKYTFYFLQAAPEKYHVNRMSSTLISCTLLSSRLFKSPVTVCRVSYWHLAEHPAEAVMLNDRGTRSSGQLSRSVISGKATVVDECATYLLSCK